MILDAGRVREGDAVVGLTSPNLRSNGFSLVRRVVGDDIESDIGGAQRAGLAGILVRTGKYREDAVQASGVEPAATVASMAAVPDLLLA